MLLQGQTRPRHVETRLGAHPNPPLEENISSRFTEIERPYRQADFSLLNLVQR
jgi:hypothetical protein